MSRERIQWWLPFAEERKNAGYDAPCYWQRDEAKIVARQKLSRVRFWWVAGFAVFVAFFLLQHGSR